MTRKIVENAGFIVGLDLGQARDYTAVVVIDRVESYDLASQGFKGPRTIEYEVPHIQRYRLGTSYPDIVENVGKLIAGLPARKRRPDLVVDGTGVGRPVVEMFEKVGLRPVPVTITSGSSETNLGYSVGVPKRNLVSVLQVVLQSGRLKIAKGLPDGPTLIDELVNFRVKISASGNESFEAWRESVHDDLVLAAALACWHAERRPPPPFIGSYGYLDGIRHRDEYRR